MTDPATQKSVFISYRRSVSRYIARAIFERLHNNGYDVFLDIENVDAGEFGKIILGQIAARAHFLVILTRGTFERCKEPGDWLRREIEFAMEQQRNIVPVLVDEFKFDDTEKAYLTGKLSTLSNYNGLSLYYDYFDAAMDRLCSRFLKQPVYGSLTPTLPEQEEQVREIVEETADKSAPTKAELSAEPLFLRALRKQRNGDLNGAIADYTEAIRINPEYAEAHTNQGAARVDQGDLVGAITDFNRAIAINPKHANAYYNRGRVRYHQGDLAGALADFDRVIEINPEIAEAYCNRGVIYGKQGNIGKAIANYDRATEINPEFAEAYNNRGIAQLLKGNIENALADCDQAVRLLADEYHLDSRGQVYFAMGQYDTAQSDFEKAFEFNPDYNLPAAGLAITHHALGRIDEAKRLWRKLLEKDQRYRDAEWVKKELNWADPLVEEARKLIAHLDET